MKTGIRFFSVFLVAAAAVTVGYFVVARMRMPQLREPGKHGRAEGSETVESRSKSKKLAEIERTSQAVGNGQGDARAAFERELLRLGGIGAVLGLYVEERKAEYMPFLRSLGLSEASAAKAFRLIEDSGACYMKNRDDFLESSDLAPVARSPAYVELSRIQNELHATIGSENVERLRHWYETGADRILAKSIESSLGGRGFHLSTQEKAILVETLFEERRGTDMHGLSLSFVSDDAKQTYITRVAKRMGAVLEKPRLDELVATMEKAAKPIEFPAWFVRRSAPGR